MIAVSSSSRVLQTQDNNVTRGFSNSHKGIDIGWISTPTDGILAHSDGKVVFCQTGHKNNQGASGNASYGNCVKLSHANGYYTLYAHMSDVQVSYGQKVSKGQIIGHMGNTGNSYGNHLHFEVRNTSDTRIDPAPYINADLPNLPTEKVVETKVDYDVEVTAKDLNIRSGPGTNYVSQGVLSPGKHHIVAESNGIGASKWGKLKTNGWISLDYAKKIEEDDEMLSYEQWKDYMEKYQAELAKKPVASWAKDAVDFVKKEELMNGDADGQFRPQSEITRQEVAAVLKNLCEKKL